MEILLTRHGAVEGIHPERFRGRMELSLTELGKKQAQALGARIAAEDKPVRVYTSPMGRCRDTGAAIAAACGIETEVLPGLNDLDYGHWQWKTHDMAKSQFPHEYALWKAAPQWMRFPGGESLQDLLLRVADGVRSLLAQHKPEDTVVLVGHDSVNRALLIQCLELPLSAYWRIPQQPCCINRIQLGSDGLARVQTLNDTAHLKDLE